MLQYQIATASGVQGLTAPSPLPTPAPSTGGTPSIGGRFGGAMGLVSMGIMAATLIGGAMSMSSDTSSKDAPSVQDGIFRMTPGGKPQLIGSVANSDAIQVTAGKSGGFMDRMFNLFGSSTSSSSSTSMSSTASSFITSIIGIPQAAATIIGAAVDNLTRVTTDRNVTLDQKVAEKQQTDKKVTQETFTTALQAALGDSGTPKLASANNTQPSQPLNITLNWDSEKLAGVIKKQVFASTQERA
jgi:hypothetical protein